MSYVRIDRFDENLMILVNDFEQEEPILVEYVECFQVYVQCELNRSKLEREEIDTVRYRVVIANNLWIYKYS